MPTLWNATNYYKKQRNVHALFTKCYEMHSRNNVNGMLRNDLQTDFYRHLGLWTFRNILLHSVYQIIAFLYFPLFSIPVGL